MRWLELRVPPLAVLVICGLLVFALRRLFPEEGVFIPFRRPIYWTLLGLGIVAGAAGVLQFRRAGTTKNPLTPEAASALVTGGIYRFTRNPMYLGMALILLAVAVFFSNPLGLAGVALFVVWITVFQIGPEERALEKKFGEAFLRYKERVRPWL